MSGDRFLTVTPMAWTTSGSVGSAMATRFCTSTWAMLTSVPSSKVTSRVYEPSLLLCDDMYSMLLDAVDLLLDRRGHGVGHDLGVGPGVAGRHPDGRRRDLRVLGDRQEARRDRPEQDDDDRDHPRQDRAVDEETGQHEQSPLERGRSRARRSHGVSRTSACAGRLLIVPDPRGRHVHELRLDGDARPDLLQADDDHPLARLQAVRRSPAGRRGAPPAGRGGRPPRSSSFTT